MKWKVVTLGICLALSANAYALLSVTDSTNADWLALPGVVHEDPVDRGAGATDMRSWGALVQTEGDTDYLYGYFGTEQMGIATDELGAYGWVAPTLKDYVFAALQIDTDRTAGNLPMTWQYLGTNPGGGQLYGWGADSMLGSNDDQSGPELNWQPGTDPPGVNTNQPVMGVDVAVEFGGRLEGFNFWGAPGGDGLWFEGSACSDSDSKTDETQIQWGSNFLEWKVSVPKIAAYVATLPDGVAGSSSVKRVWKVAARLSLNDMHGTPSMDADKSGDGDNPGDIATYQTFLYIPVSTLAGDTDEDQDVDLTDYDNLAYGWGSTGLMTGWEIGEFTADGVVDLDDYDVLAFNWGGTYPGAIPEPVTLTLLSLGGVALLRRRKK